MFSRARRRLTVLYIGLFAAAIAGFSAAFWLVLSVTLQPAFDIAPEVTNEQAAEIAYRQGLERIAVALVLADVVTVVLVGMAAWFLAARTLRPIAEAQERQRRFVADASHEIRTPLAAIRTTAEAALAGQANPDELRAALGIVVDSSARLARITNDLLLLAHSERGDVPARSERFDLSVVVAETVEGQAAGLQAPRASRAAPVVRTTLASDLSVAGDADEIGRVLAILIDNAIRYGGAHLWIRTARERQEAIAEVRDDGPGIAAVDQQRIFAPFFRVRSDAAAPPGTGLGLAIAVRLAERNRGRLTVESRPGTGSTFRLVLPLFT